MTTVSSSISTASRHAVRPVPVATDIALHLAAKDGTDVPFSYWDVWYALLSDKDFDGDLNGLADDLRSTRRGFSWSDDTRRKLSHLRDLQQRLKQAGLGLSDILAAIPPALAKAEQRRAHGRIIKHNERSYELSEPMRVLPENRLYEAALFGRWGAFPVSPEPYYQRLRSQFNWRRYYEEDDSRSLARKLDGETASASKLAKTGKFAEALACLRGIMTVTLELAEIADDSFGYIGMSFEFAFKDYLALPCEKAGIPPDVFLPDLLDLLIFEDHGFTFENTDGFFASLSREDGDLCLAYLKERMQALTALDLDHDAEDALTLIGQVAAEQNRFETFESLATEMGSRTWKRIILLADAAVRSGRRDLADRVFQAALATGDGDDVGHADFLAKKHHQLLHGTWDPDPRK